MAQQVVGVGTLPNDGTGDAARTAFTKINANTAELYSSFIASTPAQFGAKGDGVSDDTAAVQACANTGYCVLRQNTTYLVSAPIQIPSGGTFVGTGYGSALKTGFLVSNTTLPGVVQIGTSGTPARNCNVGNFSLLGAHSIGIKCVNMQWSNLFNVWQLLNQVYAYGFYFDLCFTNNISNLNVQAPTGSQWSSGNVLTFTSSRGGATSGTLNSPLQCAGGTTLPHQFIFSNGEMRLVTVAADNISCTWSPALAAGTVLTASMGAHFWFGGAFNGNTCGQLYTTGYSAFNFYLQDDTATGASSASVFNNAISQAGQIGVYLGGNNRAHVFNGFYSEGTINPIVLGSLTNNAMTLGHTFNSPLIGVPNTSSAVGYANRLAGINFDFCVSITVNSPTWTSVLDASNGQNYPRLVFSGGSPTIGHAYGYMIINAAGLPKAAVLLYQGAGYASTPTVTITNGATGGSGASVTAIMPGALSTVVITGTAGQFSCTASTLAVGAMLVISGTIGGTGSIAGYSTPTTYLVIATNGTTTFQLALANGTPLQTTAGTPTGLTYSVQSVTGLTLTAGAGGYTSVGPIPVIYAKASGCTINNPYLQSSYGATLGFPLYPFIARRTTTAFVGSGININGDVLIPTDVFSYAQIYPDATTKKTSAGDGSHFTYTYNSAGNLIVAPNAQGTATWVPTALP